MAGGWVVGRGQRRKLRLRKKEGPGRLCKVD